MISSPFYANVDGFKYLTLQYNDNTRVIKYKDDPNKYELDTINDTSYYEFDKDKRTEIWMWFKNNQLHRLNGPAKIIKTFEGKIKTEEWFVNGKHEKEGGPPSDTKLFDGFFMFGEKYRYTSFQEWNFPRKNASGKWLPRYIFFKKDKPLLYWWNTDEIQDGEYNVIAYYENGNVLFQALTAIDGSPENVDEFGRLELEETYYYKPSELSENGLEYPSMISYYKSDFKTELGSVHEEIYSQDDVKVKIVFNQYDPCLLLKLLEKYKHFLKLNVYIRNKNFYQNDCKASFHDSKEKIDSIPNQVKFFLKTDLKEKG